jgi:hypothetical protein
MYGDVGTIAGMSTMVDTEARLAAALEVVLGYARDDLPEWLPRSAEDARLRAYTEAQCVLIEYNERKIARLEAELAVIEALPPAAPAALPLAA